MNENDEKNNVINQDAQLPVEAAAIAKALARLIFETEKKEAPNTKNRLSHHSFAEEKLLASCTEEIEANKPPFCRLHSTWKRFASIMSPTNWKYAIPIMIVEILLLATMVFILGNYSHVALSAPVKYADDTFADKVTCADGLLIYNKVSVEVPADGNVQYRVSYAWSEDDTDYPSIPNAIIASYRRENEEPVLYEIALYRNSFIPNAEIPQDKTADNWFSDWREEKTNQAFNFPYDVDEIKGFCISNIDANNAKEGYGNYTYYFAVKETKGISIYTLEGTCYDSESLEEFKEIIKSSINSVSTKRKGLSIE